MSFDVLIAPTDDFALVNGAPCRRWLGVTRGGEVVEVFVALVGSGTEAGQAELDAALIDVTGHVKEGDGHAQG